MSRLTRKTKVREFLKFETINCPTETKPTEFYEKWEDLITLQTHTFDYFDEDADIPPLDKEWTENDQPYDKREVPKEINLEF